LTERAVKCGSIEPACITLLSFESGDQFMILFIVPGVTVGLSILDMMDWDIDRNMALHILYVNTVMIVLFFSNLKTFSSFLQLPILYNKANVERPSIDFKLSNRKGCLILSIESKHGLPNFQLVFHQLFWLDTKI
jgi:predicted signal transduction protein with EAL and GGDEF domain